MRAKFIVGALASILLLAPTAYSATSYSQDRLDAIHTFFERRGIHTPQQTISPYQEDMKGDGEAWADGVRIRPSVLSQSERVFRDEAESGDVQDYRPTVLLMHEQLHYVMSVPTMQSDPYLYVQYRDTDEAITQAVTLDFARQFFFVEFPEGMNYPSTYELAYAFSYKDGVVKIRKDSARCTKTKWTSKVARSWRVQLLLADFNTRERMRSCG